VHLGPRSLRRRREPHGLDVTDGGGIAPNDATNKPDEFFVFDFSAYRDTLTVTPVKGEISPLNFRAKPWRRVSDTPLRRYFSKRCPPPRCAVSEADAGAPWACPRPRARTSTLAVVNRARAPFVERWHDQGPPQLKRDDAR
jgi:hypothetical protein